jgi:hypothetical protein
MAETISTPRGTPKSAFAETLGRLAWHASYASDQFRHRKIFDKYRSYTMIPKRVYAENLALGKRVHEVPGCIVECGTWRGGMIAGLADVLGADRIY